MEKPMKKQKTKQTERGITLIALVVTIIVLLILAGVSIQMLTGQTGILKNAQQAREETVRGQIKEDVQRDIMEKMIEGKKGDITPDELYGILNNYFKDVPAPGEEADNPWNAEDFPESFPELKSKEGNYPFTLGDLYSGGLSGEETTPPTPPTPPTTTGETVTGENLSTYQGKYVDIGLDINGTNGTTDDWEIFYVGGADKDNSEGEEEGRIYLIAADYVESSKISSVLSATGLTNKNGTYSVYWSSPTWKELPTTPSNFINLVKHTQFTLQDGNPNVKAVSQLLDTTEWNKIVANAGEKDNIDFCIGGPTLEMWCAAWNANNPTSDGFANVYANGRSSSDGYYVGANKSATTTNYYVNGKNSAFSTEEQNTINREYKTFFPHTSSINRCYGYWLASPSAIDSSDLLIVGYGGYVSNNFYGGRVSHGDYNASLFGVRPVVCLKSGVQLQERKINGGTTVYDLITSD